MKKHKKIVTTRWEVIENYIKGKDIFDVGCAELIGTTTDEKKKSRWTHDKIAKVAKNLIGIDINDKQVILLKEMGYNIIVGDVTTIDLKQKFDVVFTHTVLEHIFNIFIAIKNLYMLSRDVIITVIPFIQPIHICNNKTNSYLDYWRFTPYCLDALFRQHGFSTIYISGTNLRSTSLYYLHICSRNPNRWKKISPNEINFDELPRGDIFYE